MAADPAHRPTTSLASRFAASRRADGGPSEIFDFLDFHATAPANDRLEVILIDQRLRSGSGRAIPAEEYLQACPDIESDPALKLKLVRGELLAELERGGSLELDTYATRFPELRESLSCQPEIARSAEGWPLTRAPGRSIDPLVRWTTSRAFDSAVHLAVPGIGEPLATDRFSIRRRLGAGGMGVVYQAFDRERGEAVALKTMRKVDPAALYRFKHEFRSLADMAHPNLVALHDLISDGDRWCFTMELVDGTNFLEYARGAGSPDGAGADPPATDRLRAGLVQLAEGLRALHDAGKVHRDLKPSNVMVTELGRVVILDFGLVAELQRSGVHQSTEFQLLGTVAYMAPEQAAGRPISPASDWYSVGVMLYEALTGRLPFSGSPLEILVKKQSEDPPSPGERAGGVPDDLAALCTALLSREPERRPTGSEVLGILGGRPAGVGSARVSGHPSSTLVGRARHLKALAEAFSEVQQGRAVVLRVEGRSGAGKSALIQSFLDDVEARGEAVILPGRCHEHESLPYKALDSLIDALSRYLKRLPPLEIQAVLPRDPGPLARVFPVLNRVEAVACAPRRAAEITDPHELRSRAFGALRELLARLGDRRPLILAIDDLQWGDLDSAALLADLLRPPDSPVLLAIASYRSEAAATSPFLQAFARWREDAGDGLDWRTVEVETLTASEARELACALLGADGPSPPEQVEAIARESMGIPFFVHELVRAVRGGIEAAGRSPAPSEIALDAVLMSRVGALPEEARLLLEIIALAGRPISQGVALQAAGLSAPGIASLALLRSGRLIRGAGTAGSGEIEAYHDRIREVVAARVPAELLEGHHCRLALTLEASGRADPDLLAEHFRRAGDLPTARRYCIEAAARAAASLAFDRAVAQYRLALEWSRGEAEVAGIRVGLADVLVDAGRGAEAARHYLRAAEASPSAEKLELRRKAAMHLMTSGNIDEGIGVLKVVLDGIGLALPTTPIAALRSLLLYRFLVGLRGLGIRQREERDIPPEALMRLDVCWSAASGLCLVDYVRGGYFYARHLLLALRTGEPRRAVHALAMQAGHASAAGTPSLRRVARLFAAAEAIRVSPDDTYSVAVIEFNRGAAEYLGGRWRRARESLERAEALYRQIPSGVTWELDTAQTFLLWSMTYLGSLADLRRRHAELIRLAEDRGNLYAIVHLNTYILATAKIGDDEPEIARHELDAITRRWSQQGFHIQHHNFLLATVTLELYQGRGRVALDWMERMGIDYRRSLLPHVQKVRIDVSQMRARAALATADDASDRRPLLHSAGRDARRLEREGAAWAHALARLVRAAISHGRGDRDGARHRLEEAVSMLEDVDMMLFAQAARRRLGKLVDGDGGAALVAEADSWMVGQGIRNPARMTASLAPGFGD